MIDGSEPLPGTNTTWKGSKRFHNAAQLPSVLVGDSRQRYPWLYQHVERQYPDHIGAVYVCDISKQRNRDEVTPIAEKLSGHATDVRLVQDTGAAVRHAADAGFGPDQFLENVPDAS